MIRTIEKKKKKMVVYQHSCVDISKYHQRKYKHWAKIIEKVDVSKTSEELVPVNSLIVEFRGCEGKEFHLFRMTENGKEEIAAAPREKLVDFVRIAAEELNKEIEEETEEQKVEEKAEKKKTSETKEQNQKEEEEEMMRAEKKSLVDFIEGEIMDKLFNENGDMLINVSDVTNFGDEEVIKVVEELGLKCEKAEGDGTFWVSLPEEFIIYHNNLLDMYFENQGGMTDEEMVELIDEYIQYTGFDKNGEVALNTEFWSVIILSQFERVASYMGYECEFLNPDFETEGGIVIFRKS